MITECAVCYRQKNKAGIWYAPTPEERRKYFELNDVLNISHTYCEVCLPIAESKLERELKEMKEHKTR
jgi:hypothetical protein